MILSKVKKLLFDNYSSNQIFIKNSFWLYLSEILNKGLIFLLFILIARTFSVEVYGQLSFIISYVVLFSILLDMGLTIFFIREVSSGTYNNIPKLFSNILFMKVILSIITFIILSYIFTILSFSTSLFPLIFLFFVYTVINSFSDLFRGYFRATNFPQIEAYSKIL